jgi:hypothetical protein
MRNAVSSSQPTPASRSGSRGWDETLGLGRSQSVNDASNVVRLRLFYARRVPAPSAVARVAVFHRPTPTPRGVARPGR